MKKVNINIEQLKTLINEGKSTQEMALILNVKRSFVSHIMQKLKIKSKLKRTVSSEQKLVLSIKRKQYLNDNPDKHPWRKHTKFKSVPCEKLKEWLKSKGIQFIEEFIIPNSKYNYALDIAFPDKQIGIEVNGNQHYSLDGTLKEYYQKRQNYLESLGWKIYQLHYSICFKIGEIENLIPNILNSSTKITFNYDTYIKNPKILKLYYCDCGREKAIRAYKCMACHAIKMRKVIRPNKEELLDLIYTHPMIKLQEILGVSDNSIRKWCVSYGIKWPPKGYWTRRNLGYSHEESLVSHARILKNKYFNKEQLEQIRKLILEDKLSLRKIGKLFNVSHGVISDIKYGKTYRNE